jgi:hypothetical protein
MLNKKELCILRGAPDWATHFICNKVSLNVRYAKLCDGIYSDYAASTEFLMHAWNVDYNLADLRAQKEQNDKTMKIVDAVNYLGTASNLNKYAESVYYNKFSSSFGFGKALAPNAICTIEEFDQCIKEMSDTAGNNKLVEYLCSEKQVVTKQDCILYRLKLATDKIVETGGAFQFGQAAAKAIDNALKRSSGASVESAVEWDGVGTPPVGAECVVNYHDDPRKGVITYIGAGVGCFKQEECKTEFTFSLSSVWFTKIESPAQKADKEREDKIEALVDLYYLHKPGKKHSEVELVRDVVSAIVDYIDVK